YPTYRRVPLLHCPYPFSYSLFSPSLLFFFLFFFLLMPLRPPTSILFPYTTLFRSDRKFNVFFLSTYFKIFTEWSDFNIHSLFNQDRKSTRLNSSHVSISYAVFCLKKKIIY